jgi:hypothetical protein
MSKTRICILGTETTEKEHEGCRNFTVPILIVCQGLGEKTTLDWQTSNSYLIM